MKNPKITDLDSQGTLMARATLDSGDAWHKFKAICQAQGGFETPPSVKHTRPILAVRAGHVAAIEISGLLADALQNGGYSSQIYRSLVPGGAIDI